MLLACAIALTALVRPLAGARDAFAVAYLGRIARGIDRIAWFSVAWIVVSGIPRVLTFRSFEWANAVEKNHEAGLVAKYVIAGSMILIGGYLWHRATGRVRAITNKA
jgi:hypothetical protein